MQPEFYLFDRGILHLRTKNNYYQFTLTVGDDGQLTDTQAFTVYINDAEDAPVITSHTDENTSIINVNEHTLVSLDCSKTRRAAAGA